MHAVRINVDVAVVTVLSATKDVTDWCGRYARPWWIAHHVPAESTCAGPLVVAEVDPNSYAELAASVVDSPHSSINYARAHTLVATDDVRGVVTAVSPGEALAYRSETHSGRLTIYGCDTEPVATAAARLAREAVRGVLLRAGWSVLHASAVTRGADVFLSFGAKGAGKTTTALTLATQRGWELLSNDRVFVRRDSTGGVRVLPWTSAAALGLGFLCAFGWLDEVRKRLENGEALHPTQDQRVTDALFAGQRTPLWDGTRELKAQVWPDQFPRWFGVELSAGGQAAGLIFPKVVPEATPSVVKGSRMLNEHDFMSGETEDRYPDVFRLAGGIDGGGRADERREVAARLAKLPHHSVVLGHDVKGNADFLNTLLE